MINLFNLQLMLQTLIFHHSVNQAASISSTSPAPYVAWRNKNGQNYDHSTFIGADNEVVVHWKISDGKVHLAAGVETSGWLGLGIAESGGMPGSDIFVFESASAKLTDQYAQYFAKPELDDCQNWNLTSSVTENKFILFEASRDLDTGDLQDRAIKDDSIGIPHKLIAAWGEQETMGFHAGNVAKSEIRFFTPPSTAAKNTANDDNFEVYLQVPNYKIPVDETTYEDFFFGPNELDPKGILTGGSVHMINAVYVPDDESFARVHHILLFGYYDTGGYTLPHLLSVWAPGNTGMHIPNNVGILFGKNGFKSIKMEVHYDNPNAISNIFDNSKYKLDFTSKLRENNGSILQVGDPSVALRGKKLGQGWSNWNFDCPGSCTMEYFPDQVTVYMTALHMHRAGKRIVSRHKREGKVINEFSLDYFDFNQAGAAAPVHKPFQLKKGDSFDLNCYFLDQGNNKRFGLGSSDEMCISYYFYYPAVENYSFFDMCGLENYIPSCKATYSNSILSSEANIGRTFGQSSGICDDNEDPDKKDPPNEDPDKKDPPNEDPDKKDPPESPKSTSFSSLFGSQGIAITITLNFVLFMNF